jgi:hypothetical protein
MRKGTALMLAVVAALTVVGTALGFAIIWHTAARLGRSPPVGSQRRLNRRSFPRTRTRSQSAPTDPRHGDRHRTRAPRGREQQLPPQRVSESANPRRVPRLSGMGATGRRSRLSPSGSRHCCSVALAA